MSDSRRDDTDGSGDPDGPDAPGSPPESLVRWLRVFRLLLRIVVLAAAAWQALSTLA